MKTIRRHTVREWERTGIPMGECWFAKFEELGDKLRIYGYEHLGIDHTFEFETEFGKCTSGGHPIWIVKNGFFKVDIPLGADTKTMYCADKRIIATLMKSYLEAEAGKHDRIGVFDIVDEATAEDIYAKNKIPAYTVR